MYKLNGRRVLSGALAGGVTWSLWTSVVTMKMLIPTYASEAKLGHILAQPRFGTPVFFISWFIVIFLTACIGSWLYAIARPSLGSGPKTAIKIGMALGFIAAVPINLSVFNWYPVARRVPLWWMVDMGAGCVLAVLVAAFVYEDKYKPVGQGSDTKTTAPD